MSEWGFLTNHAHVLLCVTKESDTRLRHIADCVGITERATHRIVCDLVDDGYLTKHRIGRRSYYEVNLELPLRHSLERDRQLGDLLRPFLRGGGAESPDMKRSAPDASNGSPTPDAIRIPG
ncbi:MAG: AsnC family transcriptional regulator [Actinobacteria bacterium]|nr:AsnC family transcriptional regulator [Actinomycetota bacterium]